MPRRPASHTGLNTQRNSAATGHGLNAGWKQGEISDCPVENVEKTKETQMKAITCWVAGMLLTVCAFGQEFPRCEVGADYSYVRYVPSAHSTNSHGLNGAGGSFVLNVDEYLGIRAAVQGHASTTSFFAFPPSVNFPGLTNFNNRFNPSNQNNFDIRPGLHSPLVDRNEL